jgi:5-methyltetrahydrofolate--homocysteine methyltransferase
MANMEKIVKDIKKKYPDIKILVGGAPLSQEYCDRVGADFYSPDPVGAVNYLNKMTG